MNGFSEPSLVARRVRLLLMLLTQLIVITGAIAHLAIFQWLPDAASPLARLLTRVELTHEPSLAQWYSSALFIACAVLFGAIGWSRTVAADPDAKYWYLLSALANLASIDEAIMLHEMMDRPVREWLNLGGIFTIAWIIPGTVLAVGFALVLVRFLRRLHPPTRNRFLICASLFFAGAVLMELPGGIYFARYGFTTPHYIATYAIEEWLEQMALCGLVFSLLEHARWVGLTLHVPAHPTPNLPHLPSSLPVKTGNKHHV